MKKILEFMFHRVVLVSLSIVLQLTLLYVMLHRFEVYYVYFYALSFILSIGVVLYIVNDRSNPGYQIAWIIPVLLLPIFGSLLYLIFGGKKLSYFTRKKMFQMQDQMIQSLPSNPKVVTNLSAASTTASNQSSYIEKYAYCPAYQNTYTEYLPLGEVKFERMMEELRKAEKFIFLEYFIIEKGVMWDSILNLLIEKAAEGVDVRLIYDDFGCITRLPYRYSKQLEQQGIKCCVFNPYVPILSSRLNNRDHRKICVIDGHTGFTGGINLADEYINVNSKFGHWKDSAIMVKGEAVWNFTVMFLTMWNYVRGTKEDFDAFRCHFSGQIQYPSSGFVQPYTDNPLDNEPVGETVYLNLISKARRYVYITSPYLIIGYEMVTALCAAAKSGVDVRIITPHIPDKWYVYSLAKSYYQVLLEADVKIYEYTPGFIHAKNFIVDDEYASVGTINMDYRSLYLHFECGVWMYKTNSVSQVYSDFMETLELCETISLEDCLKEPWHKKLGRAVLRVFAPLM